MARYRAPGVYNIGVVDGVNVMMDIEFYNVEFQDGYDQFMNFKVSYKGKVIYSVDELHLSTIWLGPDKPSYCELEAYLTEPMAGKIQLDITVHYDVYFDYYVTGPFLFPGSPLLLSLDGPAECHPTPGDYVIGDYNGKQIRMVLSGLEYRSFEEIDDITGETMQWRGLFISGTVYCGEQTVSANNIMAHGESFKYGAWNETHTDTEARYRELAPSYCVKLGSISEGTGYANRVMVIEGQYTDILVEGINQSYLVPLEDMPGLVAGDCLKVGLIYSFQGVFGGEYPPMIFCFPLDAIPSLINLFAKVNGSWREVKGTYAKQGDWKKAIEIYAKDNTWKN